MLKAQSSDEQILSCFQKPEMREQAFTVLVEKYQERLYNHIRRLVINHQDADDVLQNTFIKVWRNLKTFQGDSQLYTWLYRIATNESFNYLNRQKKRASTSIDDEELAVAKQLKADPYFEGDEIQRKIQKAIQRLPERQKAVFSLRYYDEMKYEDMAEVIGRSEGALKASYHHAVKKIEQFLKED